MYLEASAIDHSCIPNSISTFTKNKQLIIRTIQKVDSFLEIRISYFSNIWETTQNRREYLQNNYYFLCECPKCFDEKSDAQKSSLKCCRCDGCVPRCTGICIDCKNESFPQDILEKHDALKNKINQIIPYGADPNKGWSLKHKASCSTHKFYAAGRALRGWVSPGPGILKISEFAP